MLRVYLTPQAGLSRAMDRVALALVENAPQGIRVVSQREHADLELLHVIGYPETVDAVKRIRGEGKKYGIIQYCIRSTQEPNTAAWLDIWKGAEIVWSYYDLDALCKEDQQFVGQRALNRFYISPLGADSRVFRPVPSARPYAILTSGYVPETEGVLEAMDAADAFGYKIVHLGPDNSQYGSNVRTIHNIKDVQLAEQYSLCRYVAGLRRVEGFELPAAEGLLCGARPIMFDRPHYRRWFEGFAIFIPEGTREEVTNALGKIFRGPDTPVTDQERQDAIKRFDWSRIATGFWMSVLDGKSLQATMAPKRAAPKEKRRLLVVADAGVSTGFAKCTHNILDTVHPHWDTHVVGINFYGDPAIQARFPYPIYPPKTVSGGDAFGVQRMANLVGSLRPHLILLQNDPWNIPAYMKYTKSVPTVAALAVDGKNCRGAGLNGLRHAIFWTEFGRSEANQGGYTGKSTVIPLGVDLGKFRPMDREQCRSQLPFDAKDRERVKDAFIIGNVNRNHPRKRLDLTLFYFAEWIHTRKIDDAFLFIHSAPTGDDAVDIGQLAAYLGISNRTLVMEPEVGEGIREEKLPILYNSFDLLLSTSQGEGWGLPAMEAMACGVPTMGGKWAAYAEWPRAAMITIDCSDLAATPNRINAIGGIMDREETLKALDTFYRDEHIRKAFRQMGLALVAEPQFRWDNIGEQYLQVLDEALTVNTLLSSRFEPEAVQA